MTLPAWTTTKADTRAEVAKVGTLTVHYKATTDSYCVAVFGVRLPERFASLTEAKAAAIAVARQRMTDGVFTLAVLALG